MLQLKAAISVRFVWIIMRKWPYSINPEHNMNAMMKANGLYEGFFN